MREATVFALILAVLMGLLAVTQLNTVSTAIAAVTTGPLSQFVSSWPYIMAGIVLLVVAGFAISAVSRR
jgi:ABC-type dipeptide/oligopeptide/nickel transport system permease component